MTGGVVVKAAEHSVARRRRVEVGEAADPALVFIGGADFIGGEVVSGKWMVKASKP